MAIRFKPAVYGLVVLALVLFISGCSDRSKPKAPVSEPTPEPEAGTVGRPCADGGLCNDGLVCSGNICVEEQIGEEEGEKEEVEEDPAGDGEQSGEAPPDGGGNRPRIPSIEDITLQLQRPVLMRNEPVINVSREDLIGNNIAQRWKIIPDVVEVSFAIVYGGGGEDIANSVLQTRDGGYVVAGASNSFDEDYDGWIVRLGVQGPDWQKHYGGDQFDKATSIQQTLEGGYIVAGVTTLDGVQDLWTLRLDSAGQSVGQCTYGGDLQEEASSIRQTADEGYIVAGYTQSFGTNIDFWVLRLDIRGDPIWQYAYGGNGIDKATAVEPTGDGGYVVAGYANMPLRNGNSDFLVLKLDASGEITWRRIYGYFVGDDEAASIKQTSDGGYIVVGKTKRGLNQGFHDVLVLKLRQDGWVDWQYTYGGNGEDVAKSVIQTTDGGYIVAGYTTSFGAGRKDAWVLKLNGSGEIVWQKTYGGEADDVINSGQQTTDGGYVFAGYTSSFGVGEGDLWILKLKADGTVAACGGVTIQNSNAVRNQGLADARVVDIDRVETNVQKQCFACANSSTNVEPTSACSAN